MKGGFFLKVLFIGNDPIEKENGMKDGTFVSLMSSDGGEGMMPRYPCGMCLRQENG